MQESQKAIQLKELTLASMRLKLKSDGAVRITLDYKFNNSLFLESNFRRYFLYWQGMLLGRPFWLKMAYWMFGGNGIKKVNKFYFLVYIYHGSIFYFGWLIHTFYDVSSGCHSHSSVTFFLGYSPWCKIKYDSYLGGEVQDAIVCCVDQTHRLLV